MLKEDISELIISRLGYIQCENCYGECVHCDKSECEWQLSKETADELAEEIMQIIKKEEAGAHEANFQHKRLCDLDP